MIHPVYVLIIFHSERALRIKGEIKNGDTECKRTKRLKRFIDRVARIFTEFITRI